MRRHAAQRECAWISGHEAADAGCSWVASRGGCTRLNASGRAHRGQQGTRLRVEAPGRSRAGRADYRCRAPCRAAATTWPFRPGLPWLVRRKVHRNEALRRRARASYHARWCGALAVPPELGERHRAAGRRTRGQDGWSRDAPPARMARWARLHSVPSLHGNPARTSGSTASAGLGGAAPAALPRGAARWFAR